MGKVDKDIETLVSEGSVMPDGRRADTARAQLEYKNQLKNAGDIYVGTGDYIVNSDGTGNEIYITEGKNIQDALREDANRQQGLRLGEGTNSSYSNIVELGIGAKTEANDACQIGAGTNNVANSLQFRGRTVVNGNGEIVGDYPLGFTGRVSNINNVTWKDVWHNDIQSKNPKLITDWAFRDTSQLPWSTGEIAFVSTYEPSQAGGSPTKTNIVLDGRVYVDLGAHKVYAEGDKVGSAVNADNAGELNNIALTSVDDLINKNGSIKINGCVSFAVGETDIELDNERKIPAYSKGVIVGSTDLAIIYTTNGISGCLYYDATGKQWLWGIPNKATNAEKTGFTNDSWQSASAKNITLKTVGTYQFRGANNDFGLVYWGGYETCSAISSDGSYDNPYYYMFKIDASGKVTVKQTTFREDMKWFDEDQDFHLDYRLIK